MPFHLASVQRVAPSLARPLAERGCDVHPVPTEQRLIAGCLPIGRNARDLEDIIREECKLWISGNNSTHGNTYSSPIPP
jgi:hypothetical protein